MMQLGCDGGALFCLLFSTSLTFFLLPVFVGSGVFHVRLVHPSHYLRLIPFLSPVILLSVLEPLFKL